MLLIVDVILCNFESALPQTLNVIQLPKLVW